MNRPFAKLLRVSLDWVAAAAPVFSWYVVPSSTSRRDQPQRADALRLVA